LKYSNGDEVTLTLDQRPDAFHLSIHDNGSLIENKVVDGLGLSNMKMRAEKMKGKLTIERSNCFRILLEVPT